MGTTSTVGCLLAIETWKDKNKRQKKNLMPQPWEDRRQENPLHGEETWKANIPQEFLHIFLFSSTVARGSYHEFGFPHFLPFWVDVGLVVLHTQSMFSLIWHRGPYCLHEHQRICVLSSVSCTRNCWTSSQGKENLGTLGNMNSRGPALRQNLSQDTPLDNLITQMLLLWLFDCYLQEMSTLSIL